MKPFIRFACSAALFLGISTAASAQLTGTISVPTTSYPTLASVVTALNTQGVGTGGLTVNITANQTAPAGGYVLGSVALNASLSASNPLTLNGGGKTITAQTGTGSNDGVFMLGGTDYVTLDNFVISAAAGTTTTQQIEWGIALLKRSSSFPYDGCHYVTVSNCTITMSNISGGTGILARHSLFNSTSAGTISTTNATTTDANSHNVFKGNTLTGMTQGIGLTGINKVGSWDYNNTVGGSLATEGNNISLGINASATEYGLNVANDSVLTIKNNSFQHSGLQNNSFYLLYLGKSSGAQLISSNNFDMTSSVTTAAVYGFYNPGSSSGFNDPTAPFTFSDNKLTGTNSTATSSTFYGFYMATMNSNLATISGNEIKDLNWGSSTYSGSLYCMYYTNGSSDSLTVTNNKIERVVKNGSTSGYLYGLYILNTSAGVTGGTFTYENNKIKNVVANYYAYGHYIQSGSIEKQHISSRYNTIDSFYFNGTSTIAYFYNYFSSNSRNPEVAYNTIKNVGVGTVPGITMYTYWTNNGESPDIHHNLTDSVDVGTGNFFNYVIGTNEGGSYHDNITRNITNTINTVYGVYLSPNATPTPFRVYNNLITNLSRTGASGSGHYGIYCAGSANMDIYNNTISDLTVTSGYTNTSTGLVGIFLSSAGNYNLYNNTIRIATAGSASNFGASGVYYSSAATLNLNLRNNLIYLDCLPTGSGTVVAVRRSAGVAGVVPTNLDNASGNNVYYTPNVNNAYWYAEGTSSSSMRNAYRLATDANINSVCGSDYKAFMMPRENNTFTENNLSAVSGNPGFYAPTGSSYAKRGAAKIGGLPGIGAGQLGTLRPSAPDVGAVQFTGTAIDAAGPNITYVSQPKNSYCITQATVVATISDASGVDRGTSTQPRLYYRKTTDANVFGGANTSSGTGWKWVEATSISGDTFTFTPDYTKLQSTLAAGNTIAYFVIAQDSFSTPRVGYLTAGFSSLYCAPSVALTGSAGTTALPVSDNFSVLSLPAFSVEANFPTHCESGSSILAISPEPVGTTVVWEQSTNGTTFSVIAGATDYGYTTPVLSNTTYYRAKVYCNGSTLLATSAVDTITVAHPSLLTFPTPANRCGEGTVTLTATAAAGEDVYWFADSANNQPVATGPIFTPYVYDSTRFFVGSSVSKAGTENTAFPVVNYSNTASTIYGVVIQLNSTTNIYNTTVYARGTGSVVVGLYNSTGNVLIASSASLPVNGGGTTLPGTPNVLPVSFLNVPAGTYVVKLVSFTGSPLLHYYYNGNGLALPQTSLSGNLTIVNGFYSTAPDRYYGFFYGFETSADCISAKTGVNVNVRPAPAISATSAKQPGICLGQTDTISVATTHPTYDFDWSTGQTSNSFAVSPVTDAVYIVTATDQSGGSFDGCVRKDTVNIPVSNVPSAPVLSPTASTICGGEVVVLNGVQGVVPGTVVGPYVIGTGNITNTTTGYPAPYGRYYVGARHQMIVRATELSYAGLQAGSVLRSLAFDVVTPNGSYTDFTINLLATTAIAVNGSTMASGGTQVFTSPSFVPVAGWNKHNFTTPFVWDGTSNLLVDVHFSNCSNCTGGTTCGTGGYPYDNNAIMNLTNTSFSSTAYYRASTTSCNIGTNTAVSGTSTQRANMQFTAEPKPQVNWMPVTGLYRDTNLTLPLVIADSTNKVFASPNSTTTYTAISNYRGCKSGSSNAATVTITPTPTVTTTVSPSRKVCTGQTATISIPNGGAGTTYQWYKGAALIAGATTDSYVATTSGAYSVLATNTASGCSRRSVAENILVSAFPAATVSAITANPTCAPNTVTLRANAGTNFGYQWQKGGVDIAFATDRIYEVDSTNAYRVIVTDTATTCSSTSSAVTATVNRIEKAVTLSGPAAICTGGTVTLSVPATAGQTYVWKNGTTPVSGATSSSYTASATGNYRVVISNTATRCTDSSVVTSVIVGPPPVSNITPGSTAAVCQNDSVKLATNAGFGLSYTWYRNGTVIAGATDSVYFASTAGAYSVRVGSGPLCASTTNTATTVTVNPLPVASVFAGSATTFCSGNSVVLSGNAGSGFTYQWQRNDTVISGATQINYTASTTGNYSVRVTDANGCSRKAVGTAITVNPVPVAVSALSGLSTVCEGDPVLFSANTGTGLTYQWQRNGTNIGGATNSTYNAQASGSYRVQVSNTFGCTKASVATAVTVNPRPVVVINPGPTANLCAGSSLTLVGTSPANSQYQWSLSGSAIAGATTNQYTVTGGGSYRLRIINSLTGCRDSATTVVTSVALPVVSISPAAGTSSPICSIDSITLTASNAGSGLTYQWNKDGVAISGLAAQGSTYRLPGSLGSGTYTVTATNYAGCVTVSAPFNLVVNTTPVTIITYSAPLELCRGGAVVLNAQSTANANLTWYRNGVPVTPVDNNPFRSIFEAGSYSVRAVSPAGGCTFTSNAVTVVINELPSPVITRSSDTLFAGPVNYSAYQWYRQGVLIAGATGSFHKALSDGGYTVRVRDFKGCENVSGPYAFGAVSVAGVAKEGMKLYPNPTNGMVKVESPVAVDISVRDATGRLVRMVKNATEVDFTDLADGLYLVYLTDAKTQQLLLTEKVSKGSR